MTIQSDPCIGMKFSFEGASFEVCYADQDSIRFISCSGKQHFMTVSDWRMKENSARIAVTYEPLRVTSDCIPAGLRTEKEGRAYKRWQHYVRGLVKSFGWKWRSKEEVMKRVLTLGPAISDPTPPSYTTVTRWRKKALVEGLSNQSGVPRFIDRGRSTPYNEDELSWIKRESLEEININKRISITDLRGNLVARRLLKPDNLFVDVSFPSTRTLYRILQQVDAYVEYRARHGKKAADNRFRPAGRSFEADRFLELVFGDGQILDVLVVPANEAGEIDPEMLKIEGASYRPYLTKLMDCWARYKFPGCLSSIPFCTSTVLVALKGMVTEAGDEPRGIAEKVVFDNGSDYTSDGAKRAVSRLQFILEYAEGDYPDAKAILERYFRELNAFIHGLPGTTFSNPQDRGDYDSKRLAILTLPQLTKAVAAYDAILNDTVHGVTGRAPRRMALESIANLAPRTILPKEADHIFRVPHVLTIVSGRVKHKKLSWYSGALASYEQTERLNGRAPEVVVLIDEFNVHEVLVELKDASRTVVMATSTRPRLTQGLSLWEWNLLRKRLAEKGQMDLNEVSENELLVRRYELTQWLREEAEKNRRVARSVQRLSESRARAAAEDELDPTPVLGAIDEMPGSVSPASSPSEVPPDSPASGPELETQSLDEKQSELPTPAASNAVQTSRPATPQGTSVAKSTRSALEDFLSLEDEPIRQLPAGSNPVDILH